MEILLGMPNLRASRGSSDDRLDWLSLNFGWGRLRRLVEHLNRLLLGRIPLPPLSQEAFLPEQHS
jgi:hypothetical protein